MIHYTPGRNELEKNMEVIASMDSLVATAVEEVLVDPQDCWQPTDFFAGYGPQ